LASLAGVEKTLFASVPCYLSKSLIFGKIWRGNDGQRNGEKSFQAYSAADHSIAQSGLFHLSSLVFVLVAAAALCQCVFLSAIGSTKAAASDSLCLIEWIRLKAHRRVGRTRKGVNLIELSRIEGGRFNLIQLNST
jgi:hypothetical protein